MTPTLENPSALPRVAVVIVTQNQGAALQRCLAALGGQAMVIVVDNGANDTAGFEETFPKVRLIRLPRNFGQTKALNLGIRAAEAELVLLLSPDIQITDDAIQKLADTLEQQPGVGAVCPLLLGPSGEAADQVGELPSPTRPDPPMRPAKPGEPVSCVSGSAIMLRSFFLRALRHVDERYGDFGSAQELSQQVRRSNKSILVHPTATATLAPEVHPSSAALLADREIGIFSYLSKHFGFLSGAKYLLGRIVAALLGLRFRELMLLVSLKKIDGN